MSVSDMEGNNEREGGRKDRVSAGRVGEGWI